MTVKKTFLLLSAVLYSGISVLAQSAGFCGTDENRAIKIAQHPEILVNERVLEEQIHQAMNKIALNKLAKTTSATNQLLHVPIVFHVIHDYGNVGNVYTGYITDDQIFEVLKQINKSYLKQNPDTQGIVPPYNGVIPGTRTLYSGKANIKFELATRDPNGKPCKGITRHRSYLSYNGGDQSKLDQWAPDAYVNVWIVNSFSGAHAGAAAYATPPATGAAEPWYDGVIATAQQLDHPSSTHTAADAPDATVAHELGHVLNLRHPWGETSGIGQTVYPPYRLDKLDSTDFVDDTPPTHGHYLSPQGCVPANLYDTANASGYYKDYDTLGSLALYDFINNSANQTTNIVYNRIDYPDTVNSQNIMDYTFCDRMFTHGQCIRMRAALTSPTAGRNQLYTQHNLSNTILDSLKILSDSSFNIHMPDLAPIADFNPNKPITGGTSVVKFTNYSWNDTLSSAVWTFSNGGTNTTNSATNSMNPVNTAFSTTGWVTATLTANSNAGSGTITKSDALFVVDATGTDPEGTEQLFDNSAINAKWPIFNYYKTDHKWEVINGYGYTDKSCIRYANYDNRNFNNKAEYYVGTPDGNYADFFTQVYDLTNAKYASNCNLNFYYAGAYRTNLNSEMNDSLIVSYSTNYGNSYTTLSKMEKSQLATVGSLSIPYAPLWDGEWALKSLNIPTAAKTNNVIFRFRFYSGADNIYTETGTGNNFYIDRIKISNFALGVTPEMLENKGFVVSPNPTNANAYVTFKGGINSQAEVVVTDLTGKLVFKNAVSLSPSATVVEIPAAAIANKGMYMVQVITNGTTQTEKLIVY